MRVNNRENVDERCDGLIDEFRAACSLSHPFEKGLLVAAVAVECELAKSLQLVKE